jgi:hypothetical protein
MKRNSLTTAVVAGIAGVAGFAGLANAVDLNPDGVGQVLIYPYYTVNKSQDTQFSVVNTADVGKAVKVRFLEGYNSREVLDFNLYLSPHDVWTAAISQPGSGDASSAAQLNTRDHSCIRPALAFPYSFLPFAYDGTLASEPTDGGPTSLDRTREGYIEIISMGDIRPLSDLDAATTHDNSSGVPGAGTPNCAAIGDDTAIAADLDIPTGGLFGAGSVVNVGQGTYYNYNADAIEGFVDNSILYYPTGSLQPSLQEASNTVAAPGARAFVFANDGNLLTADYPRGIDAVSAIFMADSVYNEYNVDAGQGATSDWVFTFPTKRFYVDKLLYPAAVTAPFEEPFGGTVDGESRINLGVTTYDREELNSVIVLPECPSPVDPVHCFNQSPFLPYEVNVLSFLADGSTAPTTSTVFGSNLFRTLNAVGLTGWADVDLNAPGFGHVLGGGVSPTGGAVNINGLPVTGFYASNVINANADPGVLANYSGVFRHRAHRSCTFATANPNDLTCS